MANLSAHRNNVALGQPVKTRDIPISHTYGHEHTSQAQFATQIESRAPIASAPVGSPIQRDKHSHMDSRSDNSTSVNQNVQNLFMKKIVLPTSSEQDSIGNGEAKTSYLDTNDQVTPLSSKKGVNGEDDEEQDDILQAQIMIMQENNNTPLKGKLVSLAHVVDQPREGIPASDSQSTMPKVLLELMRAFRQESLGGRRIPRKLQKIPRAQKDLLESDSSWQPALIGKAERPGLVPVDMLDTLTREADYRATAQTNSHRLTVTPDKHRQFVTPNTAALAKDGAEGIRHIDTAILRSSTPAPSVSSEEVEWSDSADEESRRPPLPGNSPPPSISRNYLSRSNMPSISENVEVNEPLSTRLISQVNSLTSLPKDPFQIADTSQKSAMKKVDSGEHMNAESSSLAIHKNQSPLRLSSQPQHKAASKSLTNKSIKVRRTPFLPIANARTKFPHDSPEFRIPATFDDKIMRNDSRPGEMNISSSDMRVSGVAKAFEDNSSEDESTGNVDHSDDGSASLRHPNRSSEGHTKLSAQVSKAPASARLQTPNNKRAASVLDLAEKFSEKRKRTTPAQHISVEDTDPAYHEIDILRRQERRAFYERHTSRKNESSLDTTPRSPAERIVLSITSDRRPQPPSPAPTKNQPLNAVNPDSVAREQVRTIPDHTIQSGPSATSQYETGVSELFVKFKTAYKDYRGGEREFLAACHLLKQLYAKSKATHPSLWDDFVFRHFHDYHSVYLPNIIRTYGNAITYEEFYETQVEEPTHLKRIIRSTQLDTLPSLTVLQSDDQMMPDLGPNTLELHSEALPEAQKPFAPGIDVSNSIELVDHDIDMEDQANTDSQETTQSVHAWLERAAGAESPVLGTPKVNLQHSKHMSESEDIQTSRPSCEASQSLAVQEAPSPAITGRDESNPQMDPVVSQQASTIHIKQNSSPLRLAPPIAVSELPITSSIQAPQPTRRSLSATFLKPALPVPSIEKATPPSKPNPFRRVSGLRSSSLSLSSSLQPLNPREATPSSSSRNRKPSRAPSLSFSQHRSSTPLSSAAAKVNAVATPKFHFQTEPKPLASPTLSRPEAAHDAVSEAVTAVLTTTAAARQSITTKPAAEEATTTFQQFARDYNALACEREALARPRETSIKIHSWDQM